MRRNRFVNRPVLIPVVGFSWGIGPSLTLARRDAV
jgi:hypothetical protein